MRPLSIARFTVNLALVSQLILLLFSLPVSAQARLAIIIDDIGYNFPLGERAINLQGDFTFAVLPFTPHSKQLAKLAYRRGKEIMLHAPMSNRHAYPLGRGGLVSGMAHERFLAVLRAGLVDVPHVVGLNNHMGSALTEQVEPMEWLMAELQTRGLYFVDSRTSVRTQAQIVADRVGLPNRRRDVFLDNERSRDAIRQQLLRAVKLAKQNGSAIAIGHPYPETLGVLERALPMLEQYEVRLVKVSELMRATPAKVRTYVCLAPPMGLWPQVWAPIDPSSLNTILTF